MADVVLFHHALGLTPGLLAIADELRAAGHTVTTPDLFEGRTFADIESGVAHAEEIGFDTIIERGIAAAAGADLDRFVAVGWSLGVMPAQRLAQTDPRVMAAVLCDSAVPIEVFGGEWPADVPVRVHLVDGDPFAEEDRGAAEEIVAAAADGELVVHPGSGHLVADASAPAHDPVVARRILDSIVEFVGRA